MFDEDALERSITEIEGLLRARHTGRRVPSRSPCSCSAGIVGAILRAASSGWRTAPARRPPRVTAPPAVLTNARVLTVDAAFNEVEAIAIRDGRIVATGTDEAVRAAAGPEARVIDCRGRTILPGFVEPHMHLLPIAVLGPHEDVGPFRCDSVDDAIARLAERAAATPEGEWVVGRQFDPSLQTGPGTLTRDMLDRVSTTHPVYVFNASLHFGYCNTVALEVAGIDRDTPDDPGSPYGREPDGTPNGVLAGSHAMFSVLRHNPAQAPPDLIGACLSVFAKANRVGVTTLCDQGTGLAQGPVELELYRLLAESGKLSGRLRYSLSSAREDDWDRLGVSFGDGDDMLRASGWKIVSDGSNQGRSGLQREPYLGTDERGIAYVEPEVLEKMVARRAEQGWPVVVHANGDRAIDRVLDAFEAAESAGVSIDRRCRIEHCSILHDDQIERIARLGLSPSFLIGHVYYWGQAFRDELFGAQKAALLDRTAACERAGIRWTLHSDDPVTGMGPLRCIENAVTRAMWRDPSSLLAPEERVPVEAAIRAMTRDAAWQCHSDHEIGSLEPGKYADLVVLERDPRDVPTDQIGEIPVLETWLAGRRVYARDPP